MAEAVGVVDAHVHVWDLQAQNHGWIPPGSPIRRNIGAYFITKRVCLGLQRKDVNMLTHGVEIGIIRQLPNGGFVEEERPVTEEERGFLDSKIEFKALPEPEQGDENGVPSPASAARLATPGPSPTACSPRPSRSRRGMATGMRSRATATTS